MWPHIGPTWPDVANARRKTKASYTLLPLPKADSHLRLFARKSPSAFLLLKRRCPLWRQQHFSSSGARGYNTLHFAAQSRVQKGQAPFETPQQNSDMHTLCRGVYRRLLLAARSGLRVVPCRLTLSCRHNNGFFYYRWAFGYFSIKTSFALCNAS